MTVKIALAGSRYFGASVLDAFLKESGIQVVAVITIAPDDRLAIAATKAGIPVHVLVDQKVVPPEAITGSPDMIVGAHLHARVSREALSKARWGGVGYHPSLLPRHRGIAAVEWTILSGDPIAGGSVYHMAEGWDKGAVAAQDWCFVAKDDDARSLWEKKLAPMGLRLLVQVALQSGRDGSIPAFEQDEAYATKAPMMRRAVTVSEGTGDAGGLAVLAVTIVGRDRPGIVGLLADKVQRHGANWTSSQMANLHGEFAGMVRLEVPHESAEKLAVALSELANTGLNVTVARTLGKPSQGTQRLVTVSLVGDDRLGIVSRVANLLAGNNVSIEQLSTETTASASGKDVFRIHAHLLVPSSVKSEDLRAALGSVAQELTLDFSLDEPA